LRFVQRGVVLLSVCDVALQRVLQLVVLLFRSREFKELEIVVRRHELAVASAGGRLCNFPSCSQVHFGRQPSPWFHSPEAPSSFRPAGVAQRS
jgi:hypothetical protein